MADTTTSQESSKLPLPKWIGIATTSTLGVVVVAILQKYGDLVFDLLAASLGKRLVVQSIGLLFVLLGYCAWRLLGKPRTRQLRRSRALYWFGADQTPFCPYCFETEDRQLHLTGPIGMMDTALHRWTCYVCDHDYTAKDGSDYLMSPAFRTHGKRKG